MTLNELWPAIGLMTENPNVNEPRAITYLMTYPSLCAHGAVVSNDLQKFHQLAVMAYGWMPRVVRLDPHYIQSAHEALQQAQCATAENYSLVSISALANCMRSVVGASKMLHFTNPSVFPIWDSNIERSRLRNEPPYNHMSNIENYLKYVNEVHSVRGEENFDSFYTAFSDALSARLTTSRINPYNVSEVRAIEAALFELAQ